MINETHFVTDLETFDNRSTAAIASIGIACVKHGEIVGRLYTRVYVNSHTALGGTLNADTVKWWMRQDVEARREVDGSQESLDIGVALAAVRQFMEAHAPERDDRRVWGNGSSFDNVILRSAYDAAQLPPPWDFWNDRDLRTICALYPTAKAGIKFQGVKHHALDDANHEARILCAALRVNAGVPA